MTQSFDPDELDAQGLERAASILKRRTRKPNNFLLRVIVRFLELSAESIRHPERIKKR